MAESTSKGDTTRQAIAAAAYSLFLEQGYHATSMRQIAQRAGLALGGIYNHFESKEKLFDHVLLENHPYHQVLKILNDSPGETLEEFARSAAGGFLSELEKRPDLIKLLFIEINEFKGRHAPLLFQTIYPQFAPLVQRFKDRQDDLRPLPLPVMVFAFLGLLFSFFLTKYVVEPSGLLTIEGDVLENYLDVFLHGIIEPKGAPPPA